MTDKEAINYAMKTFENLSDVNTAKLNDLNTRIQNHKGEWGKRMGGEKVAENTIEMPWVKNDPLISELIDFMYEEKLLPIFNWSEWDEGSKLFTSENQTKYDKVDTETALKLIYVATRKERFAGGTLAWAFESGGFVSLINRLIILKTA